jgi:hypothetical protein
MEPGETASDDPSVELKLLVGIATIGAVLLLLTGLSLLGRGGTAGLVLGVTTVLVAVGQVGAFLALYRGHVWAFSAALAMLVSGALLQAATGDFFGALVAMFIAAALYLYREDVR